MGTPVLVQEPREMTISLKRNMNVIICEMIASEPWSLKQPIYLMGIIFALVSIIYALESLVIPSQGHLSTHLGFLISGTCLLTWASTFSTSFAFYWICSHLSGGLMASFLLLYQVVKRLPKKLSSSAVFLYSALIGLTVVSLPYIPGWFEFIREETAFFHEPRNVVQLAWVLSLRLFATHLGLICINSELLLANDGSIDICISHVMSWSIRIWAAVLILHSSEDAFLARGALVCVVAVSPLLRMIITRFIFPQSLRRTLMAKLLIMRDAIRDAVGPSVWFIIILQIYHARLREEFVRSYGKSVQKEMKRRLERSVSESQSPSSLQRQFSHGQHNNSPRFEDGGVSSAGTPVSHFLPTSRRVVQFSNGKGPGPVARIVYIAGAFDLFHAGHVEILRRARELGDFLLVGIHDDQTVSAAKRGAQRPIVSLSERSLSVGACRYVDEVINGAPWEVSKDKITTYRISLVVVHGTVAESDDFQREEENPYAVPKSMGIFRVLESPLDITTSTIISRIVANHEEAYQKRNLRKEASEKNQNLQSLEVCKTHVLDAVSI